jgi:O-antigen/teichoic acid export membrane protein
LAIPMLSFEYILFQLDYSLFTSFLKTFLTLVFGGLKLYSVLNGFEANLIFMIYIAEITLLGFCLFLVFLVVQRKKITFESRKIIYFFKVSGKALPFYIVANFSGYANQRMELFLSTLFMNSIFIVAFALAFRLIDLLLILPNSIAQATFPKLLRLSKEKALASIKVIYQRLYLLFFVSYLVFFNLGLYFLPIIFSDNANLIYSILCISLFNLIFATFGIFNGRIYVMRDLKWFYATRGIFISAIQLAGSFSLYKILGPFAVPVASLFGLLIGHLVLNAFHHKTRDLFCISLLLTPNGKS